jgi:hypothetical protein
MQNNLSETAWPQTQYLWALHPLFDWINDKAGLIYGRNEAPFIGVSDGLLPFEFVFILAGTIPNRKSAPVVDEWFGLLYKDGVFVSEMTMNELLLKTKFNRSDLPNTNQTTTEMAEHAASLLPLVVEDAGKVLRRRFDEYNSSMNPKIDAEIDKLAELEARHKEYQLSLFEDERIKSEKQRMVEHVFESFTNWVKDTLQIEDNPYLRVIAVLAGRPNREAKS